MIGLNHPSGPISPSTNANVNVNTDKKNNSDSIIQKTIEIIRKCSLTDICAIASELKNISACQYKVLSQDEQKLEEVQLYEVNDARDVKKIAANISAYVNAISLHKTLTPLQAELKLEVYNAAEYCLRKQLYLDEIVNIACALDHIDYANDSPTDQIFQRILDQLNDEIYRNQNRAFALDVWAAFALRKVKISKNALFNQFQYKILANMKSLTSLHISLVAKGFVQANFKSPKLFSALRTEAISIKDQFTVNEAVNTLWAYCYANWSEGKDPSLTRQWNAEMIEAFKPQLTQEMGQLNVDQTVRIAWTFKNMNITDVSFFNAVRERINKGRICLTLPALVNITKLLSNIKGTDDSLLIKLLSDIEERLVKDASHFTAEVLAHITYAVLIKFCYGDANFSIYEGFINRMLERMAMIEPSEWKSMNLCQLRTIKIIYEARSNKVDPQLMSKLQILIDPIESTKPQPARSSDFHLDIIKHLTRILSENQEFPKMSPEIPFECNFSLDIAFPFYQLAIEVDGHCHFDEMGNYMPKDIIKETLLQIRGWDLARITHQEWPGGNDYRSSQYDQPKRELLLNKLSAFPWFKAIAEKSLNHND